METNTYLTDLARRRIEELEAGDMSVSQRAVAALEFLGEYEELSLQRMGKRVDKHTKSSDIVGGFFNISGRTVRNAKRLAMEKPHLLDLVADGSITLNRALQGSLSGCGAPEHHVYAIAANNVDMVKIGVSSSVNARLEALQCGSPVELSIVGILYGAGFDAEKRLHSKYAEYHSHGEWYYFRGKLRDEIESWHDARDPQVRGFGGEG